MFKLPRFTDLPLRNGHPCAWDVWPTPDYFGCLNLQTPERVVEAAKLVTRGAVFALNWEMELPSPPLFGRQPFRHEIRGPEGALWADDVLHDWNTQSSSQWDGFRHIRNHDSGFYGGLPGYEHGVHHWARRGIAGRAVVADVGRWRASIGRPLIYDAPDPIDGTEVIATLAAQDVEIQEGDVLLLRTGWIGWYESLTLEQRTAFAGQARPATPGLRPGAEMAEFLWDLHIAAVAADNPMVEVMSPGSLLPPEQRAAIRNDPSRMHEVFTHTWFLPMLGLPLGEMWNLDHGASVFFNLVDDAEVTTASRPHSLHLTHKQLSRKLRIVRQHSQHQRDCESRKRTNNHDRNRFRSAPAPPGSTCRPNGSRMPDALWRGRRVLTSGVSV